MQPALLLSSLLIFLAVLLGSLAIGPVWDGVARGYVGDLMDKLRSLGVPDERIKQYMRWWGIAMFAVPFVVAVVLRMVPIAFGAAYLIFVAPRYLLAWRISQQRSLLSHQMVRATVALANSARAGLSQPQGLELLARETPEPLAAEFRRIVHDYQAGRPMADTLGEAQARLELEPFTVFSTVLLACMERGGNVAFALERIADTLQEHERLHRKLETDTASGRRTALFLGCFPIVFLFGFTVLDPTMMGKMYTTLIGQIALLGVGTMIYFSVKWCIAILNIDF